VGITASWDSRAVGLIDFDNNGSMDLVVTTQNGPPHLLKNTVVPGRHWISFKLVGTKSNRDGAGARIEIRQKGRPPQFRWATAGRTGFWASSDPRLHFGLPDETDVDVTIRWPSGTVDVHPHLSAGRPYTVTEGAKGL
ncbi:MAG: ASPIC/UnbV domain-containing protein, partial [Deltaproteobacteria bacterium]|nr:ASPIC/UnbV domain-containing protein [Deltaproteobacteria bacterium]